MERADWRGYESSAGGIDEGLIRLRGADTSVGVIVEFVGRDGCAGDEDGAGDGGVCDVSFVKDDSIK